MNTSLTDEQRTQIQERVQAGFKEFRRAVMSARPQISEDAMRGQTFTGAEGKGVGLVDRVGDFGFSLSVLVREIRGRS